MGGLGYTGHDEAIGAANGNEASEAMPEAQDRTSVDPCDYGFDTEELSCGTIVFDKHGHVLLVRAAGGTGRWGLPKGHVQPGETLEECAIRETAEETGLHVEIVSPYQHVVTYPAGLIRKKAVCLFLAVPVAGEPTDACDETTQVGFVPMGDALRRVSRELSRVISSAHLDWYNLRRAQAE